MKCAEARSLVHAALDAQVTVEERVSLSEHLSECAHCVAYTKVHYSLKKRLSAMAASKTGTVSAVCEQGAASDRFGGLRVQLVEMPVRRRGLF